MRSISNKFDKPGIGFLFFPEHVSSSVVETARRTGVKAIFDLTGIDPTASAGVLLQANTTPHAVELKLSADALFNPAVPDFLRRTNVTTIWVELHEALVPDTGALLEQISGLSDEFVIIPILASVPLIRDIIENHPEIKIIALKGNEASGFVGSETLFVLYAAVREMIQDREEAPCLAIYIAPNEELMRLAFEEGARFVICEGNEAGGHVGHYTTLTWAQVVLDLKLRSPALFEGRRIILAGGVCNRETAFMAAMLGADAVQMGTAYLAVSDIIETGSLSPLYQKMILQAEPGSTIITGEATGLRVRSLKTQTIDAICSLERDFVSKKEDEASFRRKIETLSAGSLCVAARGVNRSDGSVLDEAMCIEQGQFMSGAAAGTIKRVKSVRELHMELARGPLTALIKCCETALSTLQL